MKTFIAVLAFAAGAFAADEPTASFDVTDPINKMGGGCPNDCSGHGYCRDDAKCLCFAGFLGYDCSQRECPSYAAWGVDSAVLHEAVECSYRGSCNRNTGECECFDGFEGAACERTSCPNDCSGHGKCRTVDELSLVATGYNTWDAERVQTCDCDGGYFGSDCSLRRCPNGDDPQSVCGHEDHQVQTLQLTFTDAAMNPVTGVATATGASEIQDATGDYSFTFVDNYGNTWNTRAITGFFSQATGGAAALATEIANTIKELPNFAATDVTVAVNSDCSASSANVAATSQTVCVRLAWSGDSVSGSQNKLVCPQPFVGCPFAGCQPKFTGPRVLHESSTLANLWGTNAQAEWVPQPTGHTDKTAPYMVAAKVEWTARTNSANGVPTFKITTAEGLASAGSAAAAATHIESDVITYDSRYGSSYVEAGLGLKFKTGTVSATQSTTTEHYVVQIPGCVVNILEEADENKEASECSGRGICDRDNGLCQCFEGYSGHACNEVHVTI